MTERRKPRSYTNELKQRIVQLYHNEKRKCDICRVYDIATSLLDKWLTQEKTSGSFLEKDNCSAEEQELLELSKCNRQLEMENDICSFPYLPFSKHEGLLL